MKRFLILATFVFIVIAILIRLCDGNNYVKAEITSDHIKTNDSKVSMSMVQQNELIDTLETTIIFDSLSLELPRVKTNKPEQILVREGYTTSYNASTKNANWVSWHLTKEHTTGPWSRKGIPYIVDNDVKGSRQELEDWYDNNLPIDHGHLCPAGDNKWSKKAMIQSFLLTNMCPQNSALNQGDWEELESRCRGWANHYGEIFIAAGPIFYNKNYKTIGNNKVGVPDAFFKVILRVNKNSQALGFIYPNDGTHHKMDFYVVTVDDVESLTGIDFFYNLSDEIENKVESSSNLSLW